MERHLGLIKSDRIEELSIVEPDAIDVLEMTDEPVLTLITCYPFYYLGSAPQRYIVRARRVSAPSDVAAVGAIEVTRDTRVGRKP